MKFTTFARTGLTVSRLCLGTGTFGKQADEQESFRIFDKVPGVDLEEPGQQEPGGVGEVRPAAGFDL